MGTVVKWSGIGIVTYVAYVLVHAFAGGAIGLGVAVAVFIVSASSVK